MGIQIIAMRMKYVTIEHIILINNMLSCFIWKLNHMYSSQTTPSPTHIIHNPFPPPPHTTYYFEHTSFCVKIYYCFIIAIKMLLLHYLCM